MLSRCVYNSSIMKYMPVYNQSFGPNGTPESEPSIHTQHTHWVVMYDAIAIWLLHHYSLLLGVFSAMSSH